MESSDQSLLQSFNSKERPQSPSKPSPSDQITKVSDQSRWSSKTPEKIDSWSSQTAEAKSKNFNDSVKLPEKYEILGQFFDSLDSSIRLLRLKRSVSTFTNISPKVECLTDRRFSYGRLAQLKFILPEAIEVKKVLIHDEQTSCMKPDLHVTLNVSAVENDGKLKTNSGYSNLRVVFRARLLDFFKTHPKGDEVPEETLPEPFNHSNQDRHVNMTITPASHLSPSFQRRFSHKATNYEASNINKEPLFSPQPCTLQGPAPLHDQSNSTEEMSSSVSSPIRISSKPVSGENILAVGASPTHLLLSYPTVTPTKGIDKETAIFNETPAKLASTPAKLMVATPELQPPKRCFMGPDDESTDSRSKLLRRPPRNRSLRFDTPVKNAKRNNEVRETEGLSVDSEILDSLSENLLQSIREKERKAIEENDPAISQAKWRQQIIAGLPKLFNTIHFLFQSIRRSVITKEELMHRIVASHLDIVNRREVEEQLRLLQEIVPEWIYEKLAISGDILLCTNKITSPESIRTRLAEAK